MGCWNATCALTGLPITYETKVKLIFIEIPLENDPKEGDGHCYNSAFGKPVSHPITAIYNDYGYVENIEESPLNSEFEKYLQKKLLNPDINLSNIQKYIRDGETVFKGIHGKASIGYTMVIDEIYQELKEKIQFANSYESGVGYSYIDIHGIYDRYRKMDGVSFIESILSKFSSLYENIITKTSILEEKIKVLGSFCDGRTFGQHLRRTNSGNFLAFLVETIGDECEFYPNFRFVSHIMYEKLISGLNENEIIDYALLVYFMDMYRREWMPQPGAGSQDNDFDSYVKFFDICSRYAHEEETRFSE